MSEEDPTPADEAPLSNLSDEELGRRVRETPTFRLAVACSHFADSASELRESDPDAYDRLIDDTLEEQKPVRSRSTIVGVVGAFLDTVEKYGALGDEPEEAAAQAADELQGDDGGA